ncbi:MULTISPECIES: HlyD family type I secretion periplasmic adaptor subunit [unclassified Bradyrhizobium]|uniref:HlyD family type I secretion periplasmic adaptor subunit n=1 Tax=unclassified Bradyrhizobium TaxID=2631580 RepID=UPI001BA661C2|nr:MULTISPECIES: HlyD family type I secretion periplasmic adaptor subunit [unclassified Bradyrhizobium]MBR1224207.1 HlyD family type I secretion periplasmic adaptor subunit [Bradyrhizobium sp. AUGA SZCCT0176]MBR1301822.1 HlyD family type I secretion periplasmic adaptor subunit [Bradyrhizobium sp. AUGA SZCCT0042]
MMHVDASEFVPQPAPARSAPRERALRLWPRILAGLVLSALLVAGCGGWAAWAMLEGAVVAAGTVKVDQNLKEVQHRDGGIVKTLAVRQGDQVKEGQVLATLDDVQIKAEHLIVRAQMVEALGRRARLVAERDNLAAAEFPAEMHALFPSTAGAVIHGETRLFTGNKTARDSQKEQLELSIAQTGEEIRGMGARLAAKEEEIKLVGAEREKLQSLFDRKIVEYQRVYSAQRDYARIMGEQGEIQASIARAKVRTSEIRVQIIAVDQNASTEAQKELRIVEARIAELQERKLAVEDRLSRTEIRSPASGYINELFAYTVGGVITPAAKIATVVPENADLKFEIRISPADIDQVRVGQPARVRLSAFNRTTTPELKGKVAMVSPASARDPSNGQEHYIAHVRLLQAEEDLIQQKGLRLVPGMPAEVFVSTQERTAASYLAKPFTDQMNRAFRER